MNRLVGCIMHVCFWASATKPASFFSGRTVRSSAVIPAAAWRWRCPKRPTSACGWWSRGAQARSGWYATGSSTPGTEAAATQREGTWDHLNGAPGRRIGWHITDGGWGGEVGVGGAGGIAGRAALICPQAAQTGSRQTSLQEEDDQ